MTAPNAPTKQDYAQALSLACRYLIIAAGEEVCRRDVKVLRSVDLVGSAPYPYEALFADELEKRLDAARRQPDAVCGPRVAAIEAA